MEAFSVISGSIENNDNIKYITDVAKERYSKYQIAHHEWINNVEPSPYRNALDIVRTDPIILDKIKQRFPNTNIKSVPEVDEIYWAVSPNGAIGSDRSQVDCHYDSPFAVLPTGGIIFYRVIVACNENNTVTTIFPDENIRIQMDTGDFQVNFQI